MDSKKLLTNRFSEALSYAVEIHGNQFRKGTEIPYVSHLFAVAGLVLENGGNEDETIAALLHDAPEDQEVTIEEISERFGSKVAGIVKECSDAFEQPKPPWRERKEKYINSLPNKSKSALLVSLADKLHNSRTLYMDYQVIGEELWDRFKGKKEGTLWYCRSMVEAFRKVIDNNPMLDELDRIVTELETLALN